ncbi:hypothetical protein FIV45_09630 [Paremcibacter congregatus]|nr:hypothetical protein FIV45_09630 [Paremcibacter congregatus]
MMNRFVKVSVCALSMAAFGLAPISQAFADNRDRGHQKNYVGHHKNYKNNGRHHNKSYRKHHKKNHYRNNRHYSSRHYYGGHNYRHGYRHHRSHGGEVALGVLTGGLLFYALTANDRRNDRETVYVQQQPVYVQPPEQKWVNQRPAQPKDYSCLQVREYQTTITVGGQSVPAYGQSCLQEDGSWKLGPATPEPTFD